MFMHRAALTGRMTPGTLFRFGGGSLSKIQSWNTSSHPEEWLLASCGRTNVPLPHFFFSLTLSSSLQPSSTHLHPIRQCVRGSSRPFFFSCRVIVAKKLPQYCVKNTQVCFHLVQEDGIFSGRIREVVRPEMLSSFTLPVLLFSLCRETQKEIFDRTSKLAFSREGCLCCRESGCFKLPGSVNGCIRCIQTMQWFSVRSIPEIFLCTN